MIAPKQRDSRDRVSEEGGNMDLLATEIETFERLQTQLESTAMGRWTLIYGTSLIDTFEDFESAAVEAVKRFGRGPYLIRQVGGSKVTLPVSVVYGPLHDAT
jgi:hypothetical protein